MEFHADSLTPEESIEVEMVEEQSENFVNYCGAVLPDDAPSPSNYLSCSHDVTLLPQDMDCEQFISTIDVENDSGVSQLTYLQPLNNFPPSREEGVQLVHQENEFDDGLLGNTNQEALINHLLSDTMSFSEVAALWGETEENENEDIHEAYEVEPEKEDVLVAFERELGDQQNLQFRKRRSANRRRYCKLSPALQGLMGEANLRYARGEHEEAIKMCMEIIRQHPNSPQPYQTLGMIYEEKNMIKKSIQFLLISAFLSPDAEEWEKLAEMSLNQGDVHQAIFCWGRAIRANPQRLDYHWARCDLLEQVGDKVKALKGYTHMLKFLHPEQGMEGLQLAKEIAKIHYENQDIQLAKDALETAFNMYPSFVAYEDINLMLEVLILLQNYLACIKVLVAHTNFYFKLEGVEETEFRSQPLESQINTATACFIPPDFPVDLCNKSVEEFGDLYLDVAEAYMSVNMHVQSLPLLQQLKESQEYNVAAVWLKYSQCLATTGQLEEAAKAYKQVIILAPQHSEARLTLASILQELGRQDEAILVLHQENDKEALDSNLLYCQCKIFLTEKRLSEFINTAKVLFAQHFVHIRSVDEAEVLINNKRLSSKLEALKDLRRSLGEPIDDQGFCYTGTDIPVEDQWDLFLQLCKVLFEEKRFEELQRLCFSALGSKEFMKEKVKELEFLCLISCISNGSYTLAFSLVRELVLKKFECVRAWNLLCLIISRANNFRHNRFLLRLFYKKLDFVPLSILNGHNCLVVGTYKYCLAEYMEVYKQEPQNPMASLLLGLTFTHLACQKFNIKKHSLVIQASAFLNKYLSLRGECQESYYNLGRAMHQLNLLPQAIHYYKKALSYHPAKTQPGDPIMDLSMDIAFNLVLIYKNSGSLDLARYYTYKYIRI